MLELVQLLCVSPSANLAALHGQMPMAAVPLASGLENDARARPISTGADLHAALVHSCSAVSGCTEVSKDMLEDSVHQARALGNLVQKGNLPD